MLHRKIYQICAEGREVSVFLRDQQRWIEDAKIVDLEGDVVTIRYDTEDEDEISTWEEMVRLESIGTVTQKIASVSRTSSEITVTEDCPEAERIYPEATKLPITEDSLETEGIHSSLSDVSSSEDYLGEDCSEQSATAEQIYPKVSDAGEN
nr:DUF6679 family protein [Spirulina major]